MAITRRGLAIGLGALWVLDGALQLQPAMLTTQFATKVIAPTAVGQPEPIHSLVIFGATTIATSPVTFDLIFALVQLMIGFGLLAGRRERAFLSASVLWGLGVWIMGEGMGGLLGGGALVWNGAPGAALVYVVISLAALPSERRICAIGGPEAPPRWVAGAWLALFVALFAFEWGPSGRTGAAVAQVISSSAPSAPAALGAPIRGVAHLISHTGLGFGAVASVVLVGIGLLGLRAGWTRQVAAILGVVVALASWVFGEALGAFSSGLATDPNTGPALVLLSVALVGVRGSALKAGNCEVPLTTLAIKERSANAA